MPAADPYPPIGDYALIGDCHSVALVSRHGSIDWCCMPRFDSGSSFGRLLDWEKGGYCSIEPTRRGAAPLRSYLDGTLVLATTFRRAGGEAVLYDCFTMRRGGAGNPRRQLLRIVEGKQGRVELRLRIGARFDYGGVRPWIRHHGPRHYSAIGGDDALVIWSDTELVPHDDRGLEAVFSVRPGERVRLSLVWIEPELAERPHRELRVSDPAEAVVPVAPGPDRLGKRRGRGGGDGARRGVGEGLDDDG